MCNRRLIVEKGMSVIFWNIQSLYPKMDIVRLICEELKPDVLCISETWLNQYVEDHDVYINNYTLVRNDRKSLNNRGEISRGGGVCIYILTKYKFEVVPDRLNISIKDIESITIKLTVKDTRPIFVTSLYRPPSGILVNCISHLNDLFEFMDLCNNSEKIVGGDFNINFGINNTQTNEIKKILSRNTLRQLITEPTRIATQHTILDLILTDSEYIKHSGVLDINVSDHLPVFLLRKKVHIKTPKCEFIGRSYRNYNKESFYNRLNQHTWDEYYHKTNVNECWKIIIDRINEYLNDTCPLKAFSFSKEKQPWLNNELMVQLVNRDKAIKVARRTGNPDDLVFARKIRNRTKNLINKAKLDYYTNQLDDNRDDPRKYWQHIYNILNKNKKDNKFNLEDNNGKLLDQKDVPDFINDFFTSIGAKLVNENPKMKHEYNLPIIDHNMELFQLQEIDMDQLMPLLKQIKIYKSSGIDNISSRILKDALINLNEQLLFLINLSINNNSFPSDWKRGTVIPLPKVSNPSKVGDLRPITLLPIPSKITEKLIYSQIMNFLENNNYISGNQFGFRKKNQQ